MSFVTPAMKDALKNHVLEEVLPRTGEFQAFYMKEPGRGRMMSTLFVFTPEGIVITGDLCPGGPRSQGSVGDYGYGLEWFAHPQSELYLCSKFLTREWQIEVAERWVRDRVAAMKAEGSVERLSEWENLLLCLRIGEMGASHFYDVLQDLGFEREDEGYEYPLQTAGWLCALQQRFSELFRAKVQPDIPGLLKTN